MINKSISEKESRSGGRMWRSRCRPSVHVVASIRQLGWIREVDVKLALLSMGLHRRVSLGARISLQHTLFYYLFVGKAINWIRPSLTSAPAGLLLPFTPVLRPSDPSLLLRYSNQTSPPVPGSVLVLFWCNLPPDFLSSLVG